MWTGIRLALLLTLVVVGTLLITDRPGLEVQYFALGVPWEGRPLHTRVGEPGLEDASRVTDVLKTEVGFSIRWSGWWDVARAGEHRFSLDVNDLGYVRIDGELIVDSGGVFGKPIKSGRRTLEPGFHELEIGLSQRHSRSWLVVQWVSPGSTKAEARPLPLASLYSGRPLSVRRTLRGSFPWSRPYRQLLGAALVIALVLLLGRFALPFERLGAWVQARSEIFARPGPRAALLLGLFLLVFLATLPFTGSVRGGDDTAYLSAATFNTKNWFANRYGHVYLLKLFTQLSGGDPLMGVRVWWSFAFAVTVAALAVAVRSVGAGLQLRTLAVTLFVLFAQTSLMGLIGAGFADYSAMMFVTAAIAVYLHGLISTGERSPLRHEWHALAIGALTLGAFRSKEVSAVLLIVPALFLIVDGRLDLRRFARKLAYWTAGAAFVLALLMLLDGLILSDFFFSVGGGRLEGMGKMNFPGGRAARPNVDWLKTIWPQEPLRFLWLGVCVSAVAAGVRHRRLELRLLHLLPIAYLMALIVLYVRMPHPFSSRMLIAITPVACLMTGLLLHYAGLDDLSWKRILAPPVLIPGGLLTALVFFFVVPYRLGVLPAADFLPVSYLERYGWAPDHFVVGVLLPAAILVVAGIVALGAGQRRLRVTALLVIFLAVFGTGFEITRASLAERHAVQASALLTYPWRTFEEELSAPSVRRVLLSPDLQWRYRMSAKTRGSLANLTSGRRDFWVGLSPEFPADADVAIISRRFWSAWRREQAPIFVQALEASASWDPFEVLVLLWPKEAAEEADRLRRLKVTAEESLAPPE